jgi:FkbM family methyltransferase
MIGKAKRFVSSFTRSLASFSLKCIPARSRAEVLERFSEQMIVTAKTSAGAIRFFAPSPLLRARADGMLSKERDTIAWIDQFQDGDVFWDVGANVGVYSLYAALRGSITVLAFEPAAANFYVLSRNIESNRLSERITAFAVAFADTTRLGVLNLGACAMGTALNQFGDKGDRSRYLASGNDLTQGVLGFTIDNFIKEFTPTFPNHIKIDVDGLELLILHGAPQTLRDPRLRSVMIELALSNEGEHERAVSLMVNSGFHLVSLGEMQGTELEKAANHLFERSRKPLISM